MSEAAKYRAFARECIRWAERAQISLEHREALLDMATTWAKAAARLDLQFALIEQFDNLARKARRAAPEGSGQTLQGNGSGQTKQTDDRCGIDVLQGEGVSPTFPTQAKKPGISRGTPKSLHYRAGAVALTIWPPAVIRGRGWTGRSRLSRFTRSF